MKIFMAFLLLIVASASPEIRYFRYERPIQISAQQSSQACMILDLTEFAHAAPQLADLRLYRDEHETPYVVRVAAPLQGEEKSIAPLNLGLRGGEVVFDVAMPDGRYSDVTIKADAQNFIATVLVSGSQTEAGSTETKLGAFTIFDLTRQKLGRSTVLHLPESDFRYLHFHISKPLLPENISGFSTMRLPASKPKYIAVAVSSRMQQKGRSSVFEFTVPTNIPVDRIVFNPGDAPANFSRNVSITAITVATVPPPSQTAGDESQPSPRQITSGNLLRLHTVRDGHRIDEERLTIDAPENGVGPSALWKITIDNGDDAPVELKSVRLEMLERDLCFEATASGLYTLFYGDAALAAPRYDYASLFAPQADASQAVARPEQQNPKYEPRPDERPFTEKHPILLWAALIIVIVLLGGVALRTAKQTPQPK
jgi:hypothetical protein